MTAIARSPRHADPRSGRRPASAALFLATAILAATGSWTADAGAQQLGPALLEPRPALPVDTVASLPVDDAGTPLHRRPWVRPVASLLVPGVGQLLAGQERGLVYLATEFWLVARALSLANEGRRERAAFQELAYAAARRTFSALRMDGPFEYYETMGRFVASGEYDVDSGAAFVPEPDTSTFNGSVWLLARRTFLENPDSVPDASSPAYRAAITFYSDRAVSGAFRWTWIDARLEQDVFRAEIAASDEAFRAATNYLGVVVLNHIGSAVDALITQRLRRSATAPSIVPRVRVDSRERRVRIAWHARF